MAVSSTASCLEKEAQQYRGLSMLVVICGSRVQEFQCIQEFQCYTGARVQGWRCCADRKPCSPPLPGKQVPQPVSDAKGDPCKGTKCLAVKLRGPNPTGCKAAGKPCAVPSSAEIAVASVARALPPERIITIMEHKTVSRRNRPN